MWGAIGPSGALGLGEKDGNKVKNARTVTQIETLAGRRITQVASPSPSPSPNASPSPSPNPNPNPKPDPYPYP